MVPDNLKTATDELCGPFSRASTVGALALRVLYSNCDRSKNGKNPAGTTESVELSESGCEYSSKTLQDGESGGGGTITTLVHHCDRRDEDNDDDDINVDDKDGEEDDFNDDEFVFNTKLEL